MYCPSCGKEIIDSSEYCPYCGEKLRNPAVGVAGRPSHNKTSWFRRPNEAELEDATREDRNDFMELSGQTDFEVRTDKKDSSYFRESTDMSSKETNTVDTEEYIERGADKGIVEESIPRPTKKEKYRRIKIIHARKRRIILIIVSLLAFMAVTVIVGSGISFAGNGRQKLIRKVMKAYEKEDIDALVDLSSGIYYRKSADGMTAESYFRNIVEEHIGYYESSVGHSFKLLYQVEDVYDMSQRRRDEYVNSIMGMDSGIDKDMISAMSAAEIRITAKQGSRTVDDRLKIIMTKEGKDWKLLYLE